MSTSVICKHCNRTIGSPTGLASHMRSMHPEQLTRMPGTAPAPAPQSAAPNGNGTGLRWEDPPSGTRGPTARLNAMRAAVPDLKRNAGRWARLFDYTGPTSAGSSATKLRELFPDLEIVGRRVDGGSAIFARYIED